jgi:uncharacterized protein
MKIDLTELLQSNGNEAKVETQISSQEINLIDESLHLAKPVQISLQLINTGEMVLVHGHAETQLNLECSRCLKSFEQPMSIKINEEYAIKADPLNNIRQKDIELHSSDFASHIGKDKTIDLTDMIRQNLLLVLSQKPLCDKNCQGLKG